MDPEKLALSDLEKFLEMRMINKDSLTIDQALIFMLLERINILEQTVEDHKTQFEKIHDSLYGHKLSHKEDNFVKSLTNVISKEFFQAFDIQPIDHEQKKQILQNVPAWVIDDFTEIQKQKLIEFYNDRNKKTKHNIYFQLQKIKDIVIYKPLKDKVIEWLKNEVNCWYPGLENSLNSDDLV